MKIIPGSWRHHYLARVGIFLLVAALTVAIGGCGEGEWEGGDDYYYLAIASTYGGSVTTPGESQFHCAVNETVELVAVPDDHHHFVNWTGDVATISNVTATATNITMYDSYSIIANFELDEGWYSLTILSNYGGAITEPGEGYFAYAANTTIDLVAEPDEDYRFKEWTGDVDTVANTNAAATNITMDASYSITANFEWFDIIQVAAGGCYTVGLKADGTMVTVGENRTGQCDVGDWTDITQVDAGCDQTVGLKSDGTVVAVGWNNEGACNVQDWTDVVQVAAGCVQTVGLKSDGTVVAVGWNDLGACNVGAWTGINQTAAGEDHTVGLKSDGTVVAVGWCLYGRCDVDSWTDIIQVAAGYDHTVGLKSNGTVVAVGDNSWGQCNVASWTDIIQIAAGGGHTVGLKSDGTVVAVGQNLGQCNVDSWANIIQVAAGPSHTVGVKYDGTVVAVGDNHCGQCNV